MTAPRSPVKTRSSPDLPGDVLREILDQEARERHLAALVALCGPERHHPAHRCHRLSDEHATAQEVESLHPQRGHLAPPQTGVGQEQHDEPY